MDTSYRKTQQKSRPLITDKQFKEYQVRLVEGKKYIESHGGWNKCQKKVLDKWHLMDDDCLKYMENQRLLKAQQKRQQMAYIPLAPQITPISPTEATRKLHKKGYIKLKEGSYFKWVHADWFERYKPILKFTHDGRWIPSLDRLQELTALDAEYLDFQKQLARKEYAQRAADKQREEIKQQEEQKVLSF